MVPDEGVGGSVKAKALQQVEARLLQKKEQLESFEITYRKVEPPSSFSNLSPLQQVSRDPTHWSYLTRHVSFFGC